MKITTEELPSEMRQDRAPEERCGDLTSKTHETSIMWRTLSSIKIIDQAQEEVMHLEEEDPQNSQITTQEIHTSAANIMEEVIAPKGAQKPRRTSLEFNKRKAMMSVDSTTPNQFCPSFWQPQFMGSQPNPVTVQQFQQPQPSWQPSQQFYSQSQAIQAIQQPQPIQEIFPPPLDNSSRPESSSRTQNPKALPSFGTIMPITGGSAMEFETKRQRNNYFRSVNTIINDGPAARPEWAKVPITFTEEDFRLKSTNHNDALVIEVNIAGWVI
jgi:hypothetical protein